MWKFSIASLLLVTSHLCEGQGDNFGFLWNRVPGSLPLPGLPTDCVKRWGECITYPGGSYRVEEVVVDATNGGSCDLQYEFGCSQGPPARECTKSWGPCQNGIRREFVVDSFNSDRCVLRTESCATVPPPPVDCQKTWGQCRNGFRTEVVVTPARNGGFCDVQTEACGIACVKTWGRCTNGWRNEIIRTPARNGGQCSPTKRERCPVDCVKEWGECVGEGPSSVRREVMVNPARNGGSCQLDTEYGCRQFSRVNCIKEWGECRGTGPSSIRREIVVTPARHGGTCKLEQEYGCAPDPVDCEKRWGPCRNGIRREIVTTAAKHGGNCVLDTEDCGTDCVKDWEPCSSNGWRREVIITPARNGGKKCSALKRERCPVDCKKKWGKCEGEGPTSERQEELVVKEKYGGKCNLRTEKGCNPYSRVNCVKEWGECKGKGPTSVRKEVVVTKEKHGGTCELREERGCDKDPEEDEYADDTTGKELATLFLANFVSDPADSGAGGKPRRGATGARSLVITGAFGSGPPPFADKAETSNLKPNCTEKTNKKGDVIAIGCDDVDNIDPDIKKEEEKRAKESIRKGEKQPPSLSRRKRSDAGGNPVATSTRDVLLYLDSSGSVGPYRFNVLKDVCKAIVDALCGRISLGKYQTRIALATFNARQLLKFPFTKTDSVDEVKNKIQAVGYDYVYSYQSCIRDALEFVLTDIYTAANGARDPSYAEGDMIIMTDGCANCDFDNDGKGLQRAAYRLKLNKINVYAIGIGIEENCRKVLQVLARGGRCFHFFFLDNWDIDVEQFLYRLKRPPQDRCLDKWEYPGINCLERP